MERRRWGMAVAAAAVLLMVCVAPQGALLYARDGLEMFMQAVLPAQLPFLLCASVLMESGAVHRISGLLEKPARKLLRVPGTAVFAALMGMLTGYPAGARITGELYENGGDVQDVFRCAALASTSGPAYMLGAVGAGMLANPAAGWLIALSHWGSVILAVALLPGSRSSAAKMLPLPPVQPFGAVVGRAMSRAMEMFWTVGGFIMLFAVLTGLLCDWGVVNLLAAPLGSLFTLLGMEAELAPAAVMGLLEVTVGCKAAAQCAAPVMDKCVLISTMISLGGISITMQQLAFLAPCGVKALPLLGVKCLQGVLALVLCRVLGMLPWFTVPAWQPQAQPMAVNSLGSGAIYLAVVVGAMLALLAVDTLQRKRTQNV